jgi:uncharacterized protein YhaN
VRFESLHLKAYGPFDDAVLRFDTPAAGLQVVYGPNERGKSTALRAIGALLFGFPARTDDHFGRDYAALRVGAVLHDGARRLALMRRKGNRQTLLEFDPDTGAAHPDRPVDQAAIDAMLGGVDQRRFELMYGMGSEQLRGGGRALLDSGSALGTALFEAASGLHRLRAVAAGLKDEAEALFVPRGQRPSLNAALAEVQARQDEARVAGLLPRDWQARCDALAEAGREVERLERGLLERRGRLALAQRLLGLQPQVARWRGLAAELAALEPVALLPADAGERLAAQRQARQQARQAQTDAAGRLQTLEAALSALVVSQPHLDAATEIAQRSGRLDDLETARLDRIRLQTDAHAAEGVLRRTFTALSADAMSAGPQGAAGTDVAGGREVCAGPGAPAPSAALAERAAAWLPSRAVVAEARQQLAARRGRDGRRAAALDALAQAERTVADAQAALAVAAEPPDGSALAAAVEATQAAGDMEQRVSQLQARLATADRQLERMAAALGGPSADALARLERPPMSEVEAAQARLTEAAAARAGLQARRAGPQERLPVLQAQRLELGRRRTVLDRDTLEAARARRDALVRPTGPAEAGGRAPVDGPALALAIAEADRIADARFDDAARIVELESLAQQVAEQQRLLADCDAERRRLDAALDQDTDRWARQLAGRGLPPMDPSACREWLARHERLLEALGERDRLATELDAARREVERHRAGLQAALRDAGPPGPASASLAATLVQARERVEEAMAGAAQRGRLRTDLDRARQASDRHRAVLAEIDAERAEAAMAWARVAAALRLPAEAGPERLEAQLEEFDVLRDAAAAWDRANRDAQVADARIALVRGEVAALARRLARPAPEAGHEAAFVSACRAALAEAERARDTRLSLAGEADAQREVIAGAQRRLEEAQAVYAALRERAGAADDEALQRAVAASERRRALQQQYDGLGELVRAATGGAHDALVAEAATADPLALQAECDALQAAIEADEAARDAALAARMRAQAAFDAADGDGAAERSATAVRERLAASARLATTWARLRLARALLDQAVQRHQQRAQGPLLGAASRWFARVTAGRWRELRPDWEGDKQILLAQREDGVRLPIGQLSEGTADALYLALRLAAIEVRLAAAPPVPLLLDDVLMTFDDDRAALALQGLAELGRSNQVVYFTHHAHLVALARRVLPPGSVAIGELARGPVDA